MDLKKEYNGRQDKQEQIENPPRFAFIRHDRVPIVIDANSIHVNYLRANKANFVMFTVSFRW